MSLHARPRRLLLVIDRWIDGDPARGESLHYPVLLRPLETVPGVETEAVCPDACARERRSVDDAIHDSCARNPPDLIVLAYDILSPYQPRLPTLQRVKERHGVPIITISYDSVWARVLDQAEAFLPLVEFHVLFDSATAFRQRTLLPEKYLPLWAPVDPRVFDGEELPRDIPISFLGSIDPYADRRRALAALRDAGLDLYQSGGIREAGLSLPDYARLYRRSRLTVNCSLNLDGVNHQLKGRVFEAMLAGPLVLESANPETARLFEPYGEYVPYDDERDLVEKARYYLSHEDERRRIAARGRAKVRSHYTARSFWQRVFERLAMDRSRPYEVASSPASLPEPPLLRVAVGEGGRPLSAAADPFSLWTQIPLLRRSFHEEYGIDLPATEIRVDPALPSEAYRITIGAREIVTARCAAAANLREAREAIEGAIRDSVRANLATFFGPRQLAAWCQRAWTDERVPREMLADRALLGAVLRYLLREAVPIVDPPTILGALRAFSSLTGDPQILAEYVRRTLFRWGARYGFSGERVHLVRLELAHEREVTAEGPDAITRRGDVARGIARIARDLPPGEAVVLLCHPRARMVLRELVGDAHPGIRVVSFPELFLLQSRQAVTILSKRVLQGADAVDGQLRREVDFDLRLTVDQGV